MTTQPRWTRGRLCTAAVATLLTGTGALAQVPAAVDEGAATPLEALTGGALLLNLRPRFENVAQDGKPEHAEAFTLRTLLGWRTKPWHGLSLTVEGIDVRHLAEQDFATTRNDPRFADYPIVADPDDTDVNQLYLDYTGLPDTRLRVGRQSIKLDNVRFVGNVEFRQVMQVFNAAMVENTSLPNTHVVAGYLWRQKNILGDQHDLDMPLLNVRYTWRAGNDLTAYAYLQDQDNTGQALRHTSATPAFTDNSNRIFGARANGGYALRDSLKLLYTVEYAKQDDYSGGDGRIDAHYLHLGAGPQVGDWFLRLDYELLSSNDGRYGFQTPLGTNHLFQGWADQFLTTPAQGLRDLYVALGGKFGRVGVYAELHEFKSDRGSIDFGHEFDLGVTVPLLKGLTGKLEYADYRAGDAVAGDLLANKVDVRKFWLTLIYQF